jgi:integrase
LSAGTRATRSYTYVNLFQYGKVVKEVSIDRKHMKGGKAGKASGRTLPVFAPTKPHILAWLQRMASMLKVKDMRDIDLSTPLFMSRVRNHDGNRWAISCEQAWRIIKGIARENELQAMAWSNAIRVVQKLLGHSRPESTEAYLKSLTDREVWSAFQTAVAAA